MAATTMPGRPVSRRAITSLVLGIVTLLPFFVPLLPLERTDGKVYTIDVGKLSAVDQEFLKTAATAEDEIASRR